MREKYVAQSKGDNVKIFSPKRGNPGTYIPRGPKAERGVFNGGAQERQRMQKSEEYHLQKEKLKEKVQERQELQNEDEKIKKMKLDNPTHQSLEQKNKEDKE